MHELAKCSNLECDKAAIVVVDALPFCPRHAAERERALALRQKRHN